MIKLNITYITLIETIDNPKMYVIVGLSGYKIIPTIMKNLKCYT